MSLKFITVPSKRLAASITSSSTSFQLNNILGWDNVALTSASFGTQAFAVFRDDANSVMEIMEIDPATIASSSITILRRGLKFNADVITDEVAANKQDWVKNETIVELGSNPPHIYQFLKNYIDAVSIAGAADASSTTKGIVEIATSAEIDSDTGTGATGAKIAITPDQLAISKYGTRLPSAGEKSALAGSIGTPSSTNKYVTQAGTSDGSVDQSQTTQNATLAVGEADTTTKLNKLAQSFVAATTYLRGVTLYKIANTGTFTGTVTVSIQADSAGAPSGTALVTITKSNALYNAYSTGENLFLFTSELATTIGTTYWIVIETSTSDTANHPNLGANSAGGYASGIVKYKNATDGWVTSGSNDLYFKTFQGYTGKPVAATSLGLIDMTSVQRKVKVGILSLTGSGSDTVVHSLGKMPVTIEAWLFNATSSQGNQSFGVYDVAGNTYASVSANYNEGTSGFKETSTSTIVRMNPNTANMQSSTVISAVDENVVIFTTTNAGESIGYKIST